MLTERTHDFLAQSLASSLRRQEEKLYCFKGLIHVGGGIGRDGHGLHDMIGSSKKYMALCVKSASNRQAWHSGFGIEHHQCGPSRLEFGCIIEAIAAP